MLPKNLIELAHRERPGRAVKVPAYWLVKLHEGIPYRSQTSSIAVSPCGAGCDRDIHATLLVSTSFSTFLKM